MQIEIAFCQEDLSFELSLTQCDAAGSVSAEGLLRLYFAGHLCKCCEGVVGGSHLIHPEQQSHLQCQRDLCIMKELANSKIVLELLDSQAEDEITHHMTQTEHDCYSLLMQLSVKHCL